VLAGAGAGKTRVITYRIAYLIQEKGVKPWNIMAVTFTNKAAEEMKSRLAQLVGATGKQVWMGTFHSIGLNILRRFGDKTVAGENFAIVDQDDRLHLVRDVVKELGIDPKKFSAKHYLNYISDYKNRIDYVENRAPEELTHKFPQVFALYEKLLRNQHLIDFDDMLSLSLRLFLQHPDTLLYYKELCQYIMVDEYQDTNVIQFAFLRQLAGESGNICVVGDDDQSIYGWRGAEVENILYFEDHFRGAKEVKLVENYRSAPQILDAANRLIRNNQSRRGKELVAASERTGEVKLFNPDSEREEAEQVASLVKSKLSEGVPHSEIAILYRTNAQSRNFEVVLNRDGTPYKVVGGVGFYQRREIKDILSYLRVYNNPYDEAAYIRMMRSQSKAIERVLEFAAQNQCDLLTATEILMPVLPAKQASILGTGQHVIGEMAKCQKISEMINTVIEVSQYKEYLKQSETEEEAENRIENIYELFNAAVSYEEGRDISDPEKKAEFLAEFLATTTLVTSGDESSADSVKLMSIHAAKGLEFEVVFLTGLEERIFPLHAHDDEGDIEEERRLCYVGITRAKVFLCLTYTTSRLTHGKRDLMRPSRFLKELALSPSKERTVWNPNPNSDGAFHKGQIVEHELFGTGVVLSVDGSGDSAKVDVMFKKSGVKKLVARFLK
jgi:DNA helicase-2/ATP-dependent DNA helicase PcrA